MTFDELVEALRALDERPVSVSSHASSSDVRPVLHIQARLHRDDVDDTADWVRFVVGEIPYTDQPGRRTKLDVFEHAYFDLERSKVESAEWRVGDNGSRFLAIRIVGGSMLRVWPHSS
jgi:hypothetical protein